METYHVKIIAGVAGGSPVEKTYEPDKGSGFGYKFNHPDAAGCLKLYYGHKTVIVPIQNLILLETDL